MGEPVTDPMRAPRLSVITVTRNAVRFLDACIENVRSQGCAEIEHLVLDGASTDGSVELLERRGRELPYLRWISEPDRGQSHAMNKGIRMARGRLIGFLNVDDSYEPGILNHAIDFADRFPDPVIVAGNCRQIRPDGSIIWTYSPRRFGFTRFLLAPSGSRFPINPASYVYSRSLHDLVGDYDEADHYTMDLDFLLRAIRKARYVHEDRVWGNMLWHEASKTFTAQDRRMEPPPLQATAARHLSACHPAYRVAVRAAQVVVPHLIIAKRSLLRAAADVTRPIRTLGKRRK